MKSRSAIKQRSKELLKGNWGKAVVMVLITWASLAIWLGCSFGLLVSSKFLMGFLFFILFIPVMIMIGAGTQYVFLEWVRRGEVPEHWFKKIWQVFADHRLAGKVIRVTFASAFFEEFWKMIFVIPGVIKQFEYSQALYIMKDHHDNGENVSARQCLKESSLLMNGYKEDFFIFQLSYSGWQILGMLPLFIGMLWVNSYMEIGMMIFYDDSSKERAVRPVTVFFPDGTNIERDIRINNKVLTRANWIALGYEIVLLILGMILATVAPGVKTAIQNNTYLIDMKDSMGLKSEYYVKFYTDNENQDDEIDSYIIIPTGKEHENRTIIEKFEEAQKDNPVKFDKQMHQAYRKGVRYTVTGDQLDLESKNTTLKLSDLKVQNKGNKITGNYKFESIDDHGKVSMTKLSK